MTNFSGDDFVQCSICYAEMWNDTCPICEQRKLYSKAEKKAGILKAKYRIKESVKC